MPSHTPHPAIWPAHFFSFWTGQAVSLFGTALVFNFLCSPTGALLPILASLIGLGLAIRLLGVLRANLFWLASGAMFVSAAMQALVTALP